MTNIEFKKRWNSFSESKRDRVRAKANWEHMSLWAVMNCWWSTTDPSPIEADEPDVLPRDN